MKKLILAILLGAFCLRGHAVLNEQNLSQTLSVLRVELAVTYNDMKQIMDRLEISSKAQHQDLINTLKRSNKTALMLYSQNANYTFNQAYACHEATEQYYEFSKKMMPYGKFVEGLNQEIDRYNKLIKVLQDLPPRVTLSAAVNDKSASETIKKETELHALMEQEMQKKDGNQSVLTRALLGPDKKPLAARSNDTALKDTSRPRTHIDSLRAELEHHQHNHMAEGDHEPFTLDKKGQADRAECIKFAIVIRSQYIQMRNAVQEDSKHYEELKSHLETIYKYAQQRYKDIQKDIFVNGDRSYFSVLANLPRYIHYAEREVSDKYASKNFEYNHVRSEWRGPIIFGLVFAVFFYLFLGFAVSNLIVRVMMKRVKRLRDSETMQMKMNCIIVAASLLLFAIGSMIARNTIDHNFFIMAFGLLINYAWLVAIILLSLLMRLDGHQIKATLPLYMPIIVLGFIIIVFRIIFIPNTLVNIVFPPLLVLFFVWQLYALRRFGKEAKTSDRVYAYVSLALMGAATVIAWTGYVLLSVEVFIWWLFQLMFILTITCIYDILMRYEGRYLRHKFKLKEPIKQSYIRRDGKLIQYTWLFDLFAMCIVPVGAVWSIFWSIYLAADVFDLTEMMIHIFITPFVNVKGVCRLSVFMLVLVASMYFVFNYVCYAIKSGYRYFRIKRLAAHNKGMAVATNQANLTLFYNVTAIVVWGIYIIIALLLFQVPKSGLSIVTAGLATGVGFAMKDLLNNFFYGISLMTGRLRVGDWIECDGIRGKVDSITYQSTQIATEDGSIIAFLNSTLFNKNFKNLTRNHSYVMSKVTIGVAYGTDINRVRQLLVNAITPMMRKNKSGRDIVSTKKGINVLVSNFGDNSIDLLVVYWTLVEEKTVFDLKVKETIYNTLNEAHVEIPFPQRDIHIRQGDAPLTLQQLQPSAE